MRYSRVFVESVGYELAPIVVTSTELENRLKPMYDTLHIPPGQLEALTGISHIVIDINRSLPLFERLRPVL